MQTHHVSCGCHIYLTLSSQEMVCKVVRQLLAIIASYRFHPSQDFMTAAEECLLQPGSSSQVGLNIIC